MKRIPSAADFSSAPVLLTQNSPNPPIPSAEACGVIVETRNHFALEFVVLNVI
ncbi:MAG: hypothetical protein ACI89S_001935 [Gammaproteobacteria bacterium]|jgi:hypothetical protein